MQVERYGMKGIGSSQQPNPSFSRPVLVVALLLFLSLTTHSQFVGDSGGSKSIFTLKRPSISGGIRQIRKKRKKRKKKERGGRCLFAPIDGISADCDSIK